MVDQRRFSRVPFREPAVVMVKGRAEGIQGETRDIGLGGMFVETTTLATFGEEVVVHFHVPGEPNAYALPAIVRWVSPDGMGLQFGNIGAKETHTITGITQAAK